jgi:hypothetical protein
VLVHPCGIREPRLLSEFENELARSVPQQLEK